MIVHVVSLAALVLVAAGPRRGEHAGAARVSAVPAPAAPRTFVVRQVNGRPLPFQDRFSTTPGYEHRAHMEQAFVRLGADGTFTMTVFGAYKDVPRGTPGFAGQVRDEAVRGRWTRRGSAVTLDFAPSKRGRRVAPATGQLTDGRLVLRYTVGWDYGVQSGTRTYVLTAAYDPSYL